MFQSALIREPAGIDVGTSGVCTVDRIRSVLAHTRLLKRKLATYRIRKEHLKSEIIRTTESVHELREDSRKARVKTALVRRLPKTGAGKEVNDFQAVPLVTDTLKPSQLLTESNKTFSNVNNFEQLKQRKIFELTVKLSELNKDRHREYKDVVLGAAGREVAEEFRRARSETME